MMNGQRMSQITIVEASKQFNVTRPRIYRAIQRGDLTTTLSEDGVQLVQVQDMVRLFDNIKKKAVTKNVPSHSSDTDQKLITLLEEQLKKAEEDKAFLKQQIQDLRSDFEEYKLRIEHKQQTPIKSDVERNEHDRETESLQVEHTQKATPEQPISEKTEQQQKPERKGLLQRLVGEIFR